jgi:hypothetical protein
MIRALKTKMTMQLTEALKKAKFCCTLAAA